MKQAYIVFALLCIGCSAAAQAGKVPIRTTDPHPAPVKTLTTIPMKSGGGAVKVIAVMTAPLKTADGGGGASGTSNGLLAAQPAKGQVNPASGPANTVQTASMPATSGKSGPTLPSAISIKEAAQSSQPSPAKSTVPATQAN